MKVFLSWSGEKSKAVAEILKNWLQRVIQATEPWVSFDIEKGQRWSEKISQALSESSVSIICLDSDNLESNWIHFEAGAISKIPNSMVGTLLLDTSPEKLAPPLSMFQATIFNKKDMLKLVQDINTKVRECNERYLGERNLIDAFEQNWPILEQQVHAVLNKTSDLSEKRIQQLLASERICQLLDMVNAKSITPHVKRQWAFDSRCFVHDYLIEDTYEIAVDLYLDRLPCRILLFGRNEESAEYLKTIMFQDSIFQDHYGRKQYRYEGLGIYLTSFENFDKLKAIADELINLLLLIEKYIEKNKNNKALDEIFNTKK